MPTVFDSVVSIYWCYITVEIISSGQCVFKLSHYKIPAADILKFLQQLRINIIMLPDGKQCVKRVECENDM